MADKLHEDITKLITEAVAVRFSVQLLDVDAEFVDIHKAFISIQQDLTCLESLLSQALRAKSKLDRQVSVFKLAHQEKWDRAISAPPKKVTFAEYATGKEKAAGANLATLDSAREVRKLEDSQAYANEAVDVIRLHYYGLDKIRQDLRKRVDLLQG
jgi:hypothetical protein